MTTPKPGPDDPLDDAVIDLWADGRPTPDESACPLIELPGAPTRPIWPSGIVHWIKASEAQRAARELRILRAEVERLEDDLGGLYCHVTNGQLSKPYALDDVVRAHVDDAISELCRETSKEDTVTLRRALSAARADLLTVAITGSRAKAETARLRISAVLGEEGEAEFEPPEPEIPRGPDAPPGGSKLTMPRLAAVERRIEALRAAQAALLAERPIAWIHVGPSPEHVAVSAIAEAIRVLEAQLRRMRQSARSTASPFT